MNETKTERIHLRLTKERLAQIQENAQACGMTVQGFLTHVGENLCVVNPDFRPFESYEKQIDTLVDTINLLTYSMTRSGEYLSSDIRLIEEHLADILAIVKEDYNERIKNINEYRKMFKSEVRKIIQKRIEKTISSND